MKYIILIVVLTLLAGVAWPYVYVYRLDQALSATSPAALQRLVDLEAVRSQVKKDVDGSVSGAVGNDPGRVTRWLKDGIKLVSDTAVDANIDLEWVRLKLSIRATEPPSPRPSFMGDISYAFFESYNRFMVRLGALGDKPVHVQMDLQEDNVWRVVAIYGPE
jgi:hypothetical protein